VSGDSDSDLDTNELHGRLRQASEHPARFFGYEIWAPTLSHFLLKTYAPVPLRVPWIDGKRIDISMAMMEDDFNTRTTIQLGKTHISRLEPIGIFQRDVLFLRSLTYQLFNRKRVIPVVAKEHGNKREE